MRNPAVEIALGQRRLVAPVDHCGAVVHGGLWDRALGDPGVRARGGLSGLVPVDPSGQARGGPSDPPPDDLSG